MGLLQNEVTQFLIATRWRNWMIRTKSTKSTVLEEWKFGKAIGMLNKGEQKIFIEKNTDMEAKDRVGCGQKLQENKEKGIKQ